MSPARRRTAAAAALLACLLSSCDLPTGEGQRARPDSEGVAHVRIVDDRFEPERAEVHPGHSVDWVNRGSRVHTVTFDDGTDSGRLEPSERYERTFPEAGRFPYRCTIHAGMTGVVEVTESPAAAALLAEDALAG
jgi:plastocyanin